MDDAAVLEIGGTKLVITQDTLVEGVHFLPDDPPESVAWKLIAVNMSDLAAKGGKPLGALMAYTLRGDETWDKAFVEGLGRAAEYFGVALLGGDTVCASERHLSLTLIGEATGRVPARDGAKPGDVVYVSGTIGDGGAGLKSRRGEINASAELEAAYLMPQPNSELGQLLCNQVTAMMDVSDGLLIDANRLGLASKVGVQIELSALPLSAAYIEACGDSAQARLEAATAGDDYVLLFTTNLPLPPLPRGIQVTRVGQIMRGDGIALTLNGAPHRLPENLGWLHDLP